MAGTALQPPHLRHVLEGDSAGPARHRQARGSCARGRSTVKGIRAMRKTLFRADSLQLCISSGNAFPCRLALPERRFASLVYSCTRVVPCAGEVHRVVCPGCAIPLPPEAAEGLLQPEQHKRYQQLMAQSYVDANPTLRW